MNIYDTKPQYINDKMVKWWVDQERTMLAHGLSATSYYIEEANGDRFLVLVSFGGDILEFEKTQEAMAQAISSRKSELAFV